MTTSAAVLQTKLDKWETNVGRLDAWLNDATGTAEIAIDSGTIPSLKKTIIGVQNTTPFRVYLTESALLADLTPGDKTGALAYDTYNQFTKVGATTTGSWASGGTSPIAQALVAGIQGARGVDYLTGANMTPRGTVFEDVTANPSTWVTISTPATRFTITRSAAGLQTVGLAGLSTPWPVGHKEVGVAPTPGDKWVVEGMYTAGTLTSSAGIFVGVDPTGTGDITSSARLIIYRGRSLLDADQTGLGADGSRTITPAWVGPGGNLVVGVTYRVEVDIQADGTWLCRVFENGVQQFTEVLYGPAPPGGTMMLGMMALNGWTSVMTKVTRQTLPGTTLFVDSTVSVSGTGSLASPLKGMTDVVPMMKRLGIRDEVTVNVTSPIVYDSLTMDEKVCRRWRVNGLPGGRSIVTGQTQGDTFSWSLKAGTTKVYKTPTKVGPVVGNNVNQVFLKGLATKAVSFFTGAQRTWIDFPDTILPFVVTANDGVDMETITTGAYSYNAGSLILRLPDGVGTGNDPGTLPVGGVSLVVSRWKNVIAAVGSPEIHLRDLDLRYSTEHCFHGGAARGTLVGCYASWSGVGGNGYEECNGAFVLHTCKAKYIHNDCFGRSPRGDVPIQADAIFVSRYINCEGSHTYLGDCTSHHVVESQVVNGVTVAIRNHNEVYIESCHFHDGSKCGIITQADILVVSNTRVEGCGEEQVTNLGVGTVSAIGRTMRTYILGGKIDPRGQGHTAVKNIVTDGMALLQTDLVGVKLGLCSVGGGGGELVLLRQALAGQTADATKNRLSYDTCYTETATPTKLGGGTLGTFVPVASFALT